MDEQKKQQMMMADSRQANVLNDHTRLTGAIVQQLEKMDPNMHRFPGQRND